MGYVKKSWATLKNFVFLPLSANKDRLHVDSHKLFSAVLKFTAWPTLRDYFRNGVRSDLVRYATWLKIDDENGLVSVSLLIYLFVRLATIRFCV